MAQSITFSPAELTELVRAGAESVTAAQQVLQLVFDSSEVTAPTPPVLQLPQRIGTLAIDNVTYRDPQSWRGAWLAQFETNVRLGIAERARFYTEVEILKARNVVTAQGLPLTAGTTQPVITPSPSPDNPGDILYVTGPKGDQGEPGPGVILVSVNEVGNLIVTYEDQTTTDAGYVIGPPPTVIAGGVTAVDYGLGASVTVTEVGYGEYRLDFVTERGNFITDNLALTGTLTLNGQQVAIQRDVVALGLAF
jgi:hypothetical protein